MWNPHRGGRCPRLLWLVLLVGGLCTATAPAAPSTPPAGEQLEVSMLLRGALDVSASGAVEALHLGDERQVPPVVAGFVRRAVAGWRFDPYLQEDQPRAIRIPLILRVVGTPLDDGNLQIALRSASFQNYDPNDPTRLTWQNAAPPLYPGGAGMFGVNGDAYVLMRVGRDGRVQDAIVEQVNMRVRASPRRLAAYRKQFSRNALVAARTWSFRVPTEGESRDAPYWLVRVGVRYDVKGEGEQFARWYPYLPGPRHRPTWTDPATLLLAADAPDALPADGSLYQAGQRGPVLRTPLGGG
ncbi:TonB-dependent receptor [Stenotrophomonas rhizophila]|nr:TonB-dependent receptor [Stenotrophomonas rhizophila]